MLSADLLKQLRDETGISITECKKALEQAQGDLKRAKEILREKGQALVKDRGGKEASKGLVASYIHANSKLGVLLQLNCESDFVAKAEEFRKLAHEICLQIAASRPLFVKTEDISPEFLDGETKIYQKQLEDSGKPQKILDQIIEGKLKKYKQEVSLLSQPWIKDSSKTVQDLIDEARAKIGEKIEVARFTRYEI